MTNERRSVISRVGMARMGGWEDGRMDKGMDKLSS